MGQPIPFRLKGHSSEYSQPNAFISTAAKAEIEIGEAWWPFSSSATDQEILSELKTLKAEVQELKERLNEVLKREVSGEEDREMITLRDIPLDQAKHEIADYFRKNDGKTIDYDELIMSLKIEPLVVVHACGELEREGKIG